MKIIDTFMGNQEFDMLECRLRELERIPNLIHVLVEADVDHQDHPKPFHFTQALQAGRFDQWRHRLHIVQATGLPTAQQDPDPWSRERGQREHLRTGLRAVDAQPDDVVLHGDIDEIPTVVAARNVRPKGFVVFEQRFHPFAVDWLNTHETWLGTVAAHVRDITSFADMRDMRNRCPRIPNAGWHFSWVGGREYALDKLGSFCHPEIAEWCAKGLEGDDFLRNGYHVDGAKLTPVDVDRTWPKWIREGGCPASWFRPRVDGERMDVTAGSILGAGFR